MNYDKVVCITNHLVEGDFYEQMEKVWKLHPFDQAAYAVIIESEKLESADSVK